MTIKVSKYRFIIALLLCVVQVAGIDMYAQEATATADSIALINKENLRLLEAPVDTTAIAAAGDSIQVPSAKPRFIPNPTRATWIAAVFPGGGQIYNRKYWKLPIVYGGFMGCAYALNWNNKMYTDYQQAYMDIMDSDPNTKSYEDIFPIGFDVESQLDWSKEILRKRKDTYRRNRDLSIFVFIGVYLISIIDAYVDAELSDFDISRNLGLKIEPAVINDKRTGNSFGLQCSIKF